MERDPVEHLLAQLEGVRPVSDGWVARCPVPGHGQGNGDRHPSLSVSRGDDGRALLKCHAGCGTEGILSAISFEPADLFSESNGHNGTNGTAPKAHIVAEYNYVDEQGKLLFQAVRFDPKSFRQRRPDDKGGWNWKLGSVRRVLFHLPELIGADSAQPVFIPEGEKDVLALRALGLVATTNPMGAEKWRSEYNDQLKDRHVVLLPDNDDVGRRHVQQIARVLYGTAASIQILELPDLPDAGDVSDWIRSGGTRDALLEMVEACPGWRPARETDTSNANLPIVVVTNRQLRDASDDALDALCRANVTPHLFVRNGETVRVRLDEKERPIIEVLSEPAMRGELERSTNFRVVRKDGSEAPTPPPQTIVRDIMSRPELPFPALEAVVQTPVLRPDGSIVSPPGYDALTRLYYAPTPGLVVPPIPDEPDEVDVTAAMELIQDMIGDFPFVDQTSTANMLALLFTPIVRPAIDGPVPLAIIDAPQKGTGKTLAAEVVALTATGKTEMTGAPKKEEEWQKVLASILRQGSTFVIIDNMKDTIRSSTLERILTFEDLDRLMKQFQVHKCVIDGMPETHATRDFARKHRGRVYLNFFNENQRGSANWDASDLKVLINRTEALDASRAAIRDKHVTLPPRGSANVELFARHMANDAKVLEEDEETGAKKYKYIRTGEDHFSLAFTYALMALSRVSMPMSPEMREALDRATAY